MSMRFEVNGLKELERSLGRLRDNARSLHGTHHVPIREILTDAFIRQHRSHRTVDEWFAASPFTIKSQADFETIPNAEWDAYVRRSTRFTSWKEMLGQAGAGYFRKRLFR